MPCSKRSTRLAVVRRLERRALDAGGGRRPRGKARRLRRLRRARSSRRERAVRGLRKSEQRPSKRMTAYWQKRREEKAARKK